MVQLQLQFLMLIIHHKQDVTNTGNTVIQSIGLDNYGHVDNITSKEITLAGLGYTAPGDGTLSWAAATTGATNTTIAASLSGAYSANTSTNRTMSLAIGPALTNLGFYNDWRWNWFLKKKWC